MRKHLWALIIFVMLLLSVFSISEAKANRLEQVYLASNNDVVMDSEAPSFTSDITVSEISTKGFTVSVQATDNIGITTAYIQVWPIEDKSRMKSVDGVYDLSTQTVTYVVDIENVIQYPDDSYGITCCINDEAENGPTCITGDYPVGIYTSSDDPIIMSGKQYIIYHSIKELSIEEIADTHTPIVVQENVNYSIQLIKKEDQYEASIREYVGGPGSISIPDHIGDIPVTGIYYNAFAGCVGLTGIEIPETISRIGPNAFKDCTNVEKLVLPHNATLYEDDANIGSAAFYGMTKLREITIPVEWDQGTNGTPKFAFSNSNKIEKIHYIKSSTGEMVNRYAGFQGRLEYVSRKSLKEIDFEEGIVSIGDYAYSYGPESSNAKDTSWAITTVKLPSTLSRIGLCAFCGLKQLQAIELPEGLTDLGGMAFANTGLHEITLPESIVTISNDSFKQSESLSSIIIPDTVETVADGAFAGCVSMTDFPIHSTGAITYIGKNAFAGCTGLTEITIPETVNYIGSTAFNDCTNVEELVLPHNATLYEDDANIGRDAFYGMTKLREITIPAEWDQKTNDNHQFAFTNCNSIEKIHYIKSSTGEMINSYYKSYDRLEYKSRQNLKEIDFEEGIVSIGDYAYSYYPEDTHYEDTSWTITTVKLPSTLTQIGSYAFYGLKQLQTIELPAGLTDLGVRTFAKTDLHEITLPESIVTISFECFKQCESLSSIIIPDTVETISDGAFAGCVSMTVFPIHSTGAITYIGNNAFTGCTGLTEITIPETVNYIGYNAFKDCSNVEKLVLSHNATLYKDDANIGCAAFHGMTKLREITIPVEWDQGTNDTPKFAFSNSYNIEKIHYIKSSTGEMVNGYANLQERLQFISRQSLKEIDFEEGIVSIGNYAYSYYPEISHYPDTNWAITTLKLPSTLTRIGLYAFYGLNQLQTILIPKGVQDLSTGCFQNKTGNFEIWGYSKSAAETYATTHNIRFKAIDSSQNEPDFHLPSSLTNIEDEAFSGNAFSCILIPERVERIGSQAFADCKQLRQIIILNDDIIISDDAFEGLDNLVFICNEGSQGAVYATKHGYTYLGN